LAQIPFLSTVRPEMEIGVQENHPLDTLEIIQMGELLFKGFH